MLREDPAKQWETFGRNDPYYGVNTGDKYKGAVLSPEREAEFFGQGAEVRQQQLFKQQYNHPDRDRRQHFRQYVHHDNPGRLAAGLLYRFGGRCQRGALGYLRRCKLLHAFVGAAYVRVVHPSAMA